MEKKLFIFDLDGTLADTKALVKKGVLDFSSENKLPIPDVDAICYGYCNPDNYDFKWGVNKEEQKRLMNDAFVYVSDKIALGLYTPQLFPNAIKLITKLYEMGNVLAICTSREGEACFNILKNYSISDYFSSFRTRDDVSLKDKKPKPDPELILEIIEEQGFDKSNVFMVGDTDADIFGARNAGIKSIAVSWGYFSLEQLRETEPDYLINDFLEILEI